MSETGTTEQTGGAVDLGAFDHHAADVEGLRRMYRDLHRGCPVAHSDAHSGFYVLVGHEDVRQAAKSWKAFSSAAGTRLPPAPFRIAAIEFDPPEHAFWRDLYREVLNLATYRWFQERIEEKITELVDRFAPRGQAELVEELIDPLPVMTICEIIGIHDAERARQARRLALEIYGAAGDPAEQAAAIERYRAFCMEEIKERRRSARKDFLTRLATQPARDGELLDDASIVNLLIGFLVAGHHTTSSAMGSILTRVASDPSLRDRLVARPELIPRAVEETIRIDTPLHAFFRQTTADTTVSGVTLPAGSWVMLNYAAANRDPRAFDAPEDFDLDRPTSNHLGFGHGIHSCVGAQLARLELKLTLQHILERLPDLHLAGASPKPTWHGGNLHMIDQLEVKFTSVVR